MRPLLLALLLFGLLVAPNMLMPAGAQAKVAVNPANKLMLKAAAAMASRQFAQAESIYSQILAADGANTEAYLQRSIARREQQNANGSRSDAISAVRLANRLIQQNPRHAKAYYWRGSAYRILKHYPQARKDIETAISLRGAKNRWHEDLQAIALEEKMGR